MVQTRTTVEGQPKVDTKAWEAMPQAQGNMSTGKSDCIRSTWPKEKQHIPASHTCARMRARQLTPGLLLQAQSRTYRRATCHQLCRTTEPAEARLLCMEPTAWRLTKLLVGLATITRLAVALHQLKSSHIKIKCKGALATTTEQVEALLPGTSQTESHTSCGVSCSKLEIETAIMFHRV